MQYSHLNICKQVAGNLVNESGNVPRRGVVPKFSDLEIEALTASHCCLPGCRNIGLKFPALYPAGNIMTDIRSLRLHAIQSGKRMAAEIDGDEDYFCIDSKPIEVCRFARSAGVAVWERRILRKPPQSDIARHKACIITDINHTKYAG